MTSTKERPALLTWAAAPSAFPNPFPAPTGVAWPAGDLPAAELAEVIASRGYCRSQAEGRAEYDGERVSRHMFDEALSDLLLELAILVESSDDAADDARLDAQTSAEEKLTRRYAPVTGSPRDTWDSRYEHHRDRAAALRNIPRTTPALVASLRRTAEDIRRKPRAAAIISGRIIPRLPQSTDPATMSHDLASAWLAQFDAVDRIKRPELVRAYLGDRSPGNLTPSGIRALAASRWGVTTRLRGEDYYRPSLAHEQRGPDIAAHALALGVDPEALAAFVAECQAAATGTDGPALAPVADLAARRARAAR